MAKIELNIQKDFFNEAYLHLLNNKERWTVLYGSAGSGKSHFAVQKMILKALKYENRKILVVRKVQTTIRESIFALFLDQLKKFNILQHCKYTTSHLKITLPNGSTFIFTGLDDPEKIKSITGIDDIVIEEATDLSIEDFTQLDLRLRSKAENQQIHLMYNPVSKANWVYEFFHVKKQDSCIVLKTTYQDNKFLPSEYIQSLLSYKESNPDYYRIYALGEFGSLGQKVFSNWKEEAFSVQELIKLHPGLKVAIGLDWGFSVDYNAVMYSLVDLEQKKIYVIDEIYQKGLLNNEIADLLISKGFSKQIIMADSAEPKSIEELKRLGISKIQGVKKGPGSITHGIQFLQQFEIIVHPDCVHLIQELKDYSYKKDKATGEYINQYTGADHCIDALRYSMSQFNSKGSGIKMLSKSLFGL